MSSKAGPSRHRSASATSESQPVTETLGGTQFIPNSQELYEAIEILDERPGKYLIRWEGTDPISGKPYAPSWEDKEGCTPLLVQDWKRAKRLELQATKRKRRSTGTEHNSGSESPKRTRRDRSTTSLNGRNTRASPASGRRLQESTPKSTRRLAHVYSVKQEEDDESYRPTGSTASHAEKPRSKARSTTKDVLTDSGHSASPERVKRRRQSILHVEIPSRQRRVTPSDGPQKSMFSEDPAPENGKGKAPVLAHVGDTTDESAGSMSIVPDSQSQSQPRSDEVEKLKGKSTSVKGDRSTVDPSVFHPYLPRDTSRPADKIVIPSSGAELPSQDETINQFTSPPSKNGALENDSDVGGDDAGEEANRDESSSSPVRLREVFKDGEVMWVIEDEDQESEPISNKRRVETSEDRVELDAGNALVTGETPEHTGNLASNVHSIADEPETQAPLTAPFTAVVSATVTSPAVASEVSIAGDVSTALEAIVASDIAAPSPSANAEVAQEVATVSRLEEELQAAKSSIATLTADLERARRRERSRGEEHEFALNLYREASNKAVEAVKASQELEAQVATLKEQLNFGLRQRDIFSQAVAARERSEVTLLRSRLKVYQDQSRLTDDSVRERARRFDEVERRNLKLQEALDEQTLRNELLKDRNNELARRNDLLLAEQTGAMDDDESEFESEAEDSDDGRSPVQRPPQPVFVSAPTDLEMQDDDIDAAVDASHGSNGESGVQSGALAPELGASGSHLPLAGPEPQQWLADVSADEWWACKWREDVEGCPVLSKSRQDLEQHVQDHVRGRVDGRGANVVALSGQL